MTELHLSQQADADALLTRDPFALLIGMLLDQQIPMERAFAGPYRLAERLGDAEALKPEQIAALSLADVGELMAQPPAVHRFPGAMAARVHQVATAVVDEYDGDVTSIWQGAKSGDEVYRRLVALPGFGDQKARIFLALLGKQLQVRPRGWRQACEPYGKARSHMSVADVTGPESLQKVREWKQAAKRARRAT